VIEELQQ